MVVLLEPADVDPGPQYASELCSWKGVTSWDLEWKEAVLPGLSALENFDLIMEQELCFICPNLWSTIRPSEPLWTRHF